MKMNATTLIAPLVGLAAAFALAAHAGEPEVDPAAIESAQAPMFEELDANTDGAITEDEAANSWLAGTFSDVDTDQNGYVTKAEYEEAKS
jgi:hypothetical protein